MSLKLSGIVVGLGVLTSVILSFPEAQATTSLAFMYSGKIVSFGPLSEIYSIIGSGTILGELALLLAL